MANFCGKCGSATDVATGLCPICDSEKIDAINAQKAVANTSNFCVLCGSVINKQTGICQNPNCVNGRGWSAKNEIDIAKRKPQSANAFLSVILSICLFLTSFLAITIYGVKNTVKYDNVKEIAESVDITKLMDSEFSATESDIGRFCDYMDEQFNIYVSRNKITNFIEKSTIQSFVAEKLAMFCDEYINGDTKNAELNITKREVEKLLLRNSDVLEDELDVPISDYIIESIATWIFDEYDIVLIDADMLDESAPALYYIVKIGFSYITMLALILLSAVIIFFMLRNSLTQGFVGIGIDFIIIGGIATLTTLITLLMKNSVIWSLIGEILATLIVANIIILAIGVVLLIVRGFISKQSTKCAC